MEEHKLYLMRHFPSHANLCDIYMGQQDWTAILPDEFSVSYPEEWNNPEKRIYILSSPLLRATQSAKYIMKQFPKIEWQIETSTGLLERNLGDFEGLEKKLVNDDERYFCNHRFIIDSTPPNAEPMDQFMQRVLAVVPRIKELLLETDVLIVSHIQVLRTLICCCRGYSIEKTKEKWYDICPETGEIISVSMDELQRLIKKSSFA